MAWRRPGDKPLSEAMMVSLLTHICVTQPQWVNLHVWFTPYTDTGNQVHPLTSTQQFFMAPILLVMTMNFAITWQSLFVLKNHQMETFSALLVFGATCECPSQRPVRRDFDVLFDLRLNKRLNTQSRYRWFEMPLPSLWRHCNARAIRMYDWYG